MSGGLNYFQTRSKVKPIGIQSYLRRLEIEREVPSLRFLKRLHKAHLIKIPFENLDIHYGRKIILDVDKIYQKVINGKRGGFCYELNILMYHLLVNLGFPCYLASAHVKHTDQWGADFDHMVVIAQVDKQSWLVDVGFGKLFIEPKKIVFNIPQVDYNNYYRFDQDPDKRLILKKSKDNSAYYSIYRIDPEPRTLIEFLPMCNWHQESKKSMFTQNKLITQLFPNGRITLTDRKLQLELNGELEEKPIMNEDEFLSKLEHHFGIDSQKLVAQRFNT